MKGKIMRDETKQKKIMNKPCFSDHLLQHRAKESSAKNALNCIGQPHVTRYYKNTN